MKVSVSFFFLGRRSWVELIGIFLISHLKLRPDRSHTRFGALLTEIAKMTKHFRGEAPIITGIKQDKQVVTIRRQSNCLDTYPPAQSLSGLATFSFAKLPQKEVCDEPREGLHRSHVAGYAVHRK